MKTTKLILAGLAATAALLSNSNAQSTVAVTDPVGYITVNINGGTPAAPGVSIVGPTLVNKSEFSGVVTATPAANQLQVSGGLTAAMFNGTAPNYKYFVEITNGAGEGMWTDIVSNTANTIVTNDNLNSLVTANTTSITIRAHHTVGTFLGTTNQAGLLAGAELALADTVTLVDPATQAQTVIYYSNDEFATGWLDAGGTDHTNDTLALGQGVIIRHKADAGVGKTFTVVGHVKTGKTVIGVEAGNNIINIPNAIGTTLTSPTAVYPVTEGPELAAADTITLYLSGAPKVIFKSNDEFAPGWLDAGGTDFSATALVEGSAFLLKNTVNTSPFNITFPAQTISN